MMISPRASNYSQQRHRNGTVPCIKIRNPSREASRLVDTLNIRTSAYLASGRVRMACESGSNGRWTLRTHDQVGRWQEKALLDWGWLISKVGSSSPRDGIPCSEPSHPKAWRAEKSRVVGSVGRGGADEPERSLAQHQLPVGPGESRRTGRTVNQTALD